jgi:DNA replication protein
MLENDIGLLFWGLPGNGKTFAAACIANALCEKWLDVRMTTLAAVLGKLPALSAQEKNDYLDSLKACDLLILDDFGMERRTDYVQEQVFSLIDGRYLARKPLIVTTNLCLQELKQPADMTERRVFDRILEICVPVCFDGPSLRQEKAKDTVARYKELTGR